MRETGRTCLAVYREGRTFVLSTMPLYCAAWLWTFPTKIKPAAND